MIKILILFLTISVYCVEDLSSRTPMGNITVEITGLKDKSGHIRIALVNSKKGFLSMDKEIVRFAHFIPKDLIVRWVFKDVPYGEYAVMAFHDKNKNAILDRGAFGIPKEPYGISNNLRPRYGPPSYNKAKFKLHAQSRRLKIILK